MRTSVRLALMGLMANVGFVQRAAESEMTPDMERMVDLMKVTTPEDLAPALPPFHKGKGQRRKNRADRWKGPQGALRH